MIFVAWISTAFVGRTAIMADLDQQLKFFGIELPWLAVTLIYVSTALFFTFLAAHRRMGSERIHPLSKVQGISAVLATSILCVGGIWRQESYDVLEVVALYFLVATSIVAIVMVTPSQPEYVTGLLREEAGAHSASGLGRPGAQSTFRGGRVCDLARHRHLHLARRNRRPDCTAGRSREQLSAGRRDERARRCLFRPGDAVLQPPVRSPRQDLFRALSLSGVALADGRRHHLPVRLDAQGCKPRGPDHLQPEPARGNRDERRLSATTNEPGFTKLVQGAAITPSLFYAFIFNSLLVAARRRLHKSSLVQPKVVSPELEEAAVPV